MMVLNHQWPASKDHGSQDYWRDTETRANLDKAASAVENGNQNYWASENVQIGENRNAELAKKSAGSLVENAEELGD